MADLRSVRFERLEALKIEAIERYRHAKGEKEAALEELVALIHELDPIRRKVSWPSWMIREIARLQEGMCPACRDELPALHEGAIHVDHLIPWSLGGGNEPGNVRILHAECNLAKGRRCDDEDLIAYLRARVFNL